MWALAATAIAAGVATVVIMSRRKASPEAHFKGKVAWVTGASSGIGEELAKQLYRSGAKVILSSRGRPALEKVRDECVGEHPVDNTNYFEPYILPLDLADIDSLSGKAQDAIQHFGAVDFLFNNGGISQRASVLNTEMAVVDRIMKVDFMGPVALTKAVLPYMVQQRSGHIAVTSSTQGLVSIPYRAAYAAAKHALHGFFDCMRPEIDQYNVKVTLICPGYVRTNLSLNAVTGTGNTYGKMDPTTAKGYPADVVASLILASTAKGEKTVIIADMKTKAAVYLRLLWPTLLYTQLLKLARKGDGSSNSQ